jgi:hypothetical protein
MKTPPALDLGRSRGGTDYGTEWELADGSTLAIPRDVLPRLRRYHGLNALPVRPSRMAA